MTIVPTIEAEITPAGADYEVVRRVIERLTEDYRTQPQLDDLAAELGLSPTQLQKTFTRWAGLSPKAFLQAVTLDHARRLMRDENLPLLETSLELGLSGPGRLHDLFVTHEAMSPGEWKARGAGLTIRYGFHDSPFGIAVVMATDRGLAGLAFADQGASRRPSTTWPSAGRMRASNRIRPPRRPTRCVSSIRTAGRRRRRCAWC